MYTYTVLSFIFFLIVMFLKMKNLTKSSFVLKKRNSEHVSDFLPMNKKKISYIHILFNLLLITTD